MPTFREEVEKRNFFAFESLICNPVGPGRKGKSILKSTVSLQRRRPDSSDARGLPIPGVQVTSVRRLGRGRLLEAPRKLEIQQESHIGGKGRLTSPEGQLHEPDPGMKWY